MFEKYGAYKDSGVEWLREVPNHWEILRIKSLSLVRRGASPRPIDAPKYFSENGEYAWVRIADVTASNHYLTETKEKLSKLGTTYSVKILPGQLFLSIAGSVGKPIISRIKCCIHDGFVYFPFLKINNEFLYRVFECGTPFIGLGKHGTQLNLNTETVGNIKIALPPQNEQLAIVSFLDQKTSEIDQAIAIKEQQITLLNERKQIVIQQAVTQGFDPNVPMKDSGVEWIGQIPEHWNVVRAKYLFKEVEERSVLGNEELLSVSHLTGVTPRCEKNVSMFMAEDYSGSKVCKKHDLVMNIMWAWMGALGVSNYDGIVSPAYGVYRQKVTNTFNSEYLEYLLKTTKYIEHYNRVSTGLHSSRLRFYGHMFFNMKLGFPCLDEQNEIVASIKNQTSKIELTVENLTNQIEKLKEYKTTLINDAVTGKIKVA